MLPTIGNMSQRCRSAKASAKFFITRSVIDKWLGIVPLLLVGTVAYANSAENLPTSQLLSTIVTSSSDAQVRDAYIEMAAKFATGTDGLPENARAALRLYNHAARMGYPHSGLPPLGSAGPGFVVRHRHTNAPEVITDPIVLSLEDQGLAGDLPFLARAKVTQSTQVGLIESLWTLNRINQSSDVSIIDSFIFDHVFWEEGEYVLQAVALDQEGRIYTASDIVSVSQDTTTPRAPETLKPKNASSVTHYQSQTFEWRMADGASAYHVEVRSPQGELLSRLGPLLAADICVDVICTVESPRGYVLPGTHQWLVYGENAVGASVIANDYFTVEYPPAASLCALTEPDMGEYVVAPMPLSAAGELPLPLGVPVLDPTFGSPITRITNNPPGSSSFTRHVYSTMQPWNSDESLLLMYHNDGATIEHRLYDGMTYEFIRSLDIQPSDLEEIFWSYHHPETFFYLPKSGIYRGFLVAHNALTGSEEPVGDFRSICEPGAPTAGNDIQMHSLDNDLFGFRCGSGTDQTMISYRRSTNEIQSASLGDDTDWYPWIAAIPSTSGTAFYLNGQMLSQELTPNNLILDMNSFFEHSSLGTTAAGSSALFQVSFSASPNGCNVDSNDGVGQIIMHDLETGECRGLVTSDQGYPYPHSGTHVSATSYKQPGWVVASSIGNANQLQTYVATNSGGAAAPTLLNEIYIANSDPSNPKVCRLAHHRSFGSRSVNGSYTKYFGEPHPVLSPSGTRVLFASDWYDSGSVNAYVIDLN
jgi:hypothetical protein